MKITIEFENEDAADDARDALDGYKWRLAVWDIDQKLRDSIKYDDKLHPEVADAFEKLRDEIREILSSYKIQMDD